MKNLIQYKATALIVFIALSLAACNHGTKSAGKVMAATPGTATMNMPVNGTDSMKEHATAMVTGVFADTTVNGTVQFDAVDGKVKMKLEITIPLKANKSVAVHIHEKGDCSNMGKGAGDHWNPTNAQHGKWGSASFHSGDIGNVTLDDKGYGTMEMETNLWSLGGDAKTNIIGKSIIVHGGVDDFVSQPSGNAGTRIGCGIIQ